MVEAWEVATLSRDMSLTDIKLWGKLVEPGKNTGSFRNCGVTVGEHVPPGPQELDRLMKRWHENIYVMTPEEAYKEFELIHPFLDGNGRVGKIIYNYLKGTMDNPVLPPNFFGCYNL